MEISGIRLDIAISCREWIFPCGRTTIQRYIILIIIVDLYIIRNKFRYYSNRLSLKVINNN